MSDRTWLGSSPQQWADHNLCQHPSMEALCKAAAWKLPAKVYSPTRTLMAHFLSVMEENHSMTWDDFWELKIGSGEDGCEWTDYAGTPTKASIEVMEMFGGFIEALRKQNT